MSEHPPGTGPVGRGELPPIAMAGSELRVEYASWLERIDDELIGGALLVSEALPRVTAAFLAGDVGAIDYTRSVADDVCERVRFVEEQGFLMLAREAPVSGDLRRLVSILRLVFAVERSAALQRHVAELLDRVDPVLLPDPVRRRAEELGCRATEVFRRGVDAWRTRDGLAVTELDRLDNDVDRLADGLLAQADHLTDAADLMALGLLARYWERIADHGVSFAQHATFAVTGERIEVGP